MIEPVEILRDRWGINHIYAKNERDLFFAQGYMAARDRLFQLELWRRQATGTLAEILGRREIKRDIGARLHRFRGELKKELDWYHQRGEEIITSFVDGVNASIARALESPETLPLEFKLLGITPAPWTPAVVISRHGARLGNVEQELSMAQAVRVMGVEKVKALHYFQGGDPDLEMDPAIDPSLLSNEILELYTAFRNPVRFTSDNIAPPYRDLIRPEDRGSNAWAVSGKLSASGFPLLVSDPHRVQGVPSLRYWVHLVAPGWNVIGGGEPALPGISIGHNEFGAWGLAVFGTDTEDLYVYDTNPANPDEYRYQGAWEPMRVVHESISVQGETPVAVDLKYTRHGPVLYEDREHHKAYALRAAWLDVGGAPYLASLRMDQAKSWDEFVEACTWSRIPAESMVWADRAGNIGQQVAGVAPQRPNWSGLVPVPGDGRYEWKGYLPVKDLPRRLNPEEGFIVAANQYLVPPGYPHPEAMHFTWTDPFRALRIGEVLGSAQRHSLSDMLRLENDHVSIPARSLVPLLKDLPLPDGSPSAARGLLLAWDAVVDKDSVAAGVYEMWLRRLLANLRHLLVPEEARPFLWCTMLRFPGSPSLRSVIDWLQAPDSRFGDDPAAGRDVLLARSLSEAVAELTKRFGGDMRAWHWGQAAYHHALLRHPLAGAASSGVRAKLNVGPVPRGGDAHTVSATGGADEELAGGSFKILVDTGDWDRALGINAPGQSGDPESPHYQDLFKPWSRGECFPVFYSRARVESVTEERLTIRPRNGGF